mmetsp:Transcript_100300/g.178326  ORF Transcript_100300/g.178326 Transcript_100300/m.178326 type:complete len:311 (-) Transcript_100300:42-974(-)|eukprot:CAMPEP_0197660090 /NCGR_PEP_ID=MMETSP1338-20131121/50389_1 /TAXON_ID=43686 ORGANISM="Pelagodinium beii, Strain RCC1491" /NCGR_SAMPLE_ID=MMETSP1338 /ASSEMBLY_ACC=CAM_ASM_000754 /LENGTH=310 /DNA_ID=CAMNT_0043237337 /DNA_START=55 /DNA_END=987 /DNA_ORIENTATION=+
MPVYEDDFGFSKPAWHGKGKRLGECQPEDTIGIAMWDVKPEKEVVPRTHELDRPTLDKTWYAKEGINSRRLKKPVLNEEGEALTSQRASSGQERPQGLKSINFIPAVQRAWFDSKKRCFDYGHKPTGYENPDQWETIPTPGERPSHPVSAVGVVALDRKAAFPEKQNAPTGIIPALSKPPSGAEWGGWASDGAPGRAPMQQPWDSLQGPGEDPQSRFCDARTKRFPEMTYNDTYHLTRWHLDAKTDIDPISLKRIGTGNPTKSFAASTAGRNIAQAAAGKPSNNPIEGTSLDWYDKIRAKETKKAPLTAR